MIMSVFVNEYTECTAIFFILKKYPCLYNYRHQENKQIIAVTLWKPVALKWMALTLYLKKKSKIIWSKTEHIVIKPKINQT